MSKKPDEEALALEWSKKLVLGVWLKKTRCDPSPGCVAVGVCLTPGALGRRSKGKAAKATAKVTHKQTYNR